MAVKSLAEFNTVFRVVN